jgi:penicillin amidase
MRWIVRLAALLGVTLAAAAVAGVWLLRTSLPPEPARYSSDGVSGLVEIRYDSRRRPFVRAGSLADALFAQGWLHARERLWQMELLRRAGRGRLAEGLGAGMLDADRELWTAGVPQLGAELQANASAFLSDQADAYVAGVNAGIATLKGLPPEFVVAGLPQPSWQPADVFAIGALMAHQSANNAANERLRLALAAVLDPVLFQAFLPDETALTEPFPYVLTAQLEREDAVALADAGAALRSLDARLMPAAALGSSGWVVASDRSASARPLFAFDSHDDLSMPNLFYEVHLFFGDQQIRGWSVAGLPGVINGFNRTVAWGLTNIGDTQDLFVEEFHPDDPDLVRGPDGWYPVRLERVEIPVAGRTSPEVLEIRHSRHGPIVLDDPPLALRWTGHDIGRLGMDAFLAMNLAEDWPAFEAALGQLPAPSTNVTYADVHGTIAFRTAGLLPVRKRGAGLLPQIGADAGAGWTGYVAMAQMPRRVNPPAGFLAAANARVAAHGPLVSADNAPGYRAQRLHEVLSAGAAFTLDDMQQLQLDWHNTQAQRLLPSLLDALEGAALSNQAAAAAGLLRSWQDNPVNAPDLAGPVIYEHFYIALAEAVFGPALPAELFSRLLASNYVLNHALDRVLLDESSPWWNGRRRDTVADAFHAAVAAAAARLGGAPSSWRWDGVQRVALHHELAGEIPLAGGLLNRHRPWGGGPATLGRARYRYHQPFLARAGATVRVVAELGSRIEARAIIPGGQAGHPLSSHYADQFPAWLDGVLEPLAPTPEDVAGPADLLVPASGPDR